jgi:hypothetical protein
MWLRGAQRRLNLGRHDAVMEDPVCVYVSGDTTHDHFLSFSSLGLYTRSEGINSSSFVQQPCSNLR